LLKTEPELVVHQVVTQASETLHCLIAAPLLVVLKPAAAAGLLSLHIHVLADAVT
jgi:hypothetical protein